VPVFGRKIPEAIMALFGSATMVNLAATLGVKIPRYALQPFVQSKMHKVHKLIDAARALPACDAPPNAAAVERLAAFVNDFAALTPQQVPSLEAWRAFVNGHTRPGWEERLHFDHVLGNFGFDEQVAWALRNTVHVEADPATGDEETFTLQHYSVRWLSKAFTGFSVQGCLADVANLVFAMAKQKPREGADEAEIAQVIDTTGRKILDGDFTDLWIPTHVVHDAETDDMLSWLLLEHVHRQLGTELQVLVQLPDDPEFDCVADAMERHERVKVFRDDHSTNQLALRDCFSWMYPELKKKKK